MQLESPTVDRIFARCSVRYGSLWLGKWEGLQMEAVRRDWARELERLLSQPRVIEYGLVNLPVEFPPNAAQFHELCKRAPEDLWNRVEQPKLEAPPVNPEGLKRIADELARVRNLQARRNPRQWAYDLQAMEAGGERLLITQRTMWRRALETVSDESINGEFVPIPAAHLPPGMRPKTAVVEAVSEAERMEA